MLVDAGYRKIPNGSVVLTREELANIKTSMDILCKKIESDEEVPMAKLWEEARVRKETEKETIKKVLNALGTKCDFCGKYKGCVCLRKIVEDKVKEKYGLEVE